MMELLSGSSPSVQQQMAASNNPPNGSNGQMPNGHAERLLADFFDAFPSWDMTAARAAAPQSMQHLSNEFSPPITDYTFNNYFGGVEQPSSDLGNIGMPRPPITRPRKFPSESSSNSSMNCGWCEVSASIRCIDCNEFMCNNCLQEHRKSPVFANHAIVALPTPIGTASSPTSGVSSATLTAGPPVAPPVAPPPSPSYICDQHNEMLRYVCDSCKKLVCQCCTLHEHKEHNYASIASFVDEANDKIQSAIESSRTGTKCIKSSIDKALTFIRMIERNCIELSDTIRKAFRQFIIAIEDRERFLLDFVDKLRQRRLATLHDQMAGLKSALSGLAETSDMLQKIIENSGRMDHIEIAMKIANGERQLEQFAAIYKDLQPKQEMFGFIAPDYNILQDIRNQGGVVLVDEQNMPIVNGGGVLAAVGAEMGAVMPITNNPNMPVANVAMPPNMRRPFIRENSFHSIPSPLLPPVRGGSACGFQSTGLEWELSVLRTSPNLHFGAPRSTQAIPGSLEHVKARNSNTLSLSFATEGHDDGQVSRPWGLCVDKMGHVLISDRRNNRVQVFNPDGNLKFKFGRKGVGNGEFDLPAGICVDIDNRIIVVDKDNHRVQIFNAAGMYLLKFGSYGKEYGQFQYPWDVAVNSRRQIVVTDSRNHRIQQFDSEGRFIRQIVFDNHGQNKGIASPRGVCYTPTGNIIVSDFDNHCLYLIDPDINEIISAKGHEGTGIQEFNRPSGICCDDDGRIIVADSKNQRIIVYSPSLEYLWSIEIRPSVNPLMPQTLDEKDRTCDVALMPDGRIVFLIELSPDSKEGTNPYKRFVHVF
ncbi:PREDICTED: protein wech isoform X1 [Bactrocera latifrons]|uniref:Protein wech n=1 Tax=Bactrocera latifrons TaxID=174628 RepID=A0A0K8W4P7_BACLA|nr:PREDICTED: protein wech isoform X1 [Bactrocera latifrons]